jgi:hypothetical protein
VTIDNRKKALDELAALSQELGLYDGQTCPVCGVPLIAANFQYGGDEGVGGRGGVWGYCNGLPALEGRERRRSRRFGFAVENQPSREE